MNNAKTQCFVYAYTEPDGYSWSLPNRLNELKELYKGKLTVYYSPEHTKVAILQDGSFFAISNEYSELPDDLKKLGKTKDMTLFRNYIAYFLKTQKTNGISVNNVAKKNSGYASLTKFVNADYSFKETAYSLDNFYSLQMLFTKLSKAGFIYRECVVQQGGRTSRKLKKRKTLRRK